MTRILNLGNKHSDTGYMVIDGDDIVSYTLDKKSDGEDLIDVGPIHSLFMGNGPTSGASYNKSSLKAKDIEKLIEDAGPDGTAVAGLTVTGSNGQYTLEFKGKGGPDSYDYLNVTLLDEYNDFINDDGKVQDTIIFASDDAKDLAALGYSQNNGKGSNFTAEGVVTAIENLSAGPGADTTGDPMFTDPQFTPQELVGAASVGGFTTEVYQIGLDTVTLVDDVAGSGGLFDFDLA